METSTEGQVPFRLTWAAGVPLLCAVHCVATPLVVLFSPALALSTGAEAAVQALAVLLAAMIAPFGIRAHRRWEVVLPMVAGAGLWLIARTSAPAGGWEIALDVSGALLIAGGMVWNARLRHRAACHSCGCPAHGHG
ncbi:MAG TPA: MerC domain-containing protein [Longimicrobium sp.]|nr:MerC domain-containing protein [Longimicrobium sp.]